MKASLAEVVGMSVTLLLAACSGRSDDAPTPAPIERHADSSARSVAPAAAPMPIASPGPSPSASDALPGDAVAELKQEVLLLRREVAAIRQQLARVPGNASGAEAGPDPRTDPDARVEAQRVERLRIASSESAFRGEQKDARWSQGTAATVRAALSEADDAVRNQVRSIECRSQSCRVELSADASGALARDLPVIVNRLGQALPNVTAGQIDQGDGRQATVLYLSR